jgi:hypothetical protein
MSGIYAPCFVPRACATYNIVLLRTTATLSPHKTDVGQRLTKLVDNMRKTQVLPVWENENNCQYCSMMRFCQYGMRLCPPKIVLIQIIAEI